MPSIYIWRFPFTYLPSASTKFVLDSKCGEGLASPARPAAKAVRQGNVRRVPEQERGIFPLLLRGHLPSFAILGSRIPVTAILGVSAVRFRPRGLLMPSAQSSSLEHAARNAERPRLTRARRARGLLRDPKLSRTALPARKWPISILRPLK